jgi:hypothetical protein
MEKVRIRDLAKELGMETSKEVLAFLERIGQKGKSASSNIEGDVIEQVRNRRKTARLPETDPRGHASRRIPAPFEQVVLRRAHP